MKIGGIEINGPNEVLLVLPREEDDIIIKARAVLDMDTFEEMCPEPKPPSVRKKTGIEPNPDDPGFKQQMANYNEKRLAFIVVKSLEPSNIEWDTVDPDDIGTLENWTDDFRNAGLATVEINRIIQVVMEANALDESKLEAARQVFLRGQRQAASESSGPATEPESM
jgi:hypothetical protein